MKRRATCSSAPLRAALPVWAGCLALTSVAILGSGGARAFDDRAEAVLRLAVLPDLQKHTAVWRDAEIGDQAKPEDLAHVRRLGDMARWIVAHRPDAVIGVGDITQHDFGPEYQAYLFRLLEPLHLAGLPVLNIAGNHDYAGNGPAMRRETRWNKYLGPDVLARNWQRSETFSPQSSEHAYGIAEGRNGPFGVLGLSFSPPEEALVWAAEVLRQNAETPFFFTTHALLDERGGILGVRDLRLEPSPSFKRVGGDTLVERLLRPHANVVAGFCGHQHGWAETDVGTSPSSRKPVVLRNWQDHPAAGSFSLVEVVPASGARPASLRVRSVAARDGHVSPPRYLPLSWDFRSSSPPERRLLSARREPAR